MLVKTDGIWGKPDQHMEEILSESRAQGPLIT